MEHLFVSARRELLGRWLEAFAGAALLSHPNDLSSHRDLESAIVWLDLDSFATAENDALLRQVVAGPFPVVVMTAVPDEASCRAALNFGAAGCCHLLAAAMQLQEIAQVVSSGGFWLGRGLLQRLLAVSVDAVAASPPSVINDLLDKLTAREQMVATEAARGASNREIAERLAITERTVKAHMSVIFEKLAVRDRVALALRLNNISA